MDNNLWSFSLGLPFNSISCSSMCLTSVEYLFSTNAIIDHKLGWMTRSTIWTYSHKLVSSSTINSNTNTINLDFLPCPTNLTKGTFINRKLHFSFSNFPIQTITQASFLKVWDLWKSLIWYIKLNLSFSHHHTPPY